MRIIKENIADDIFNGLSVDFEKVILKYKNAVDKVGDDSDYSSTKPETVEMFEKAFDKVFKTKSNIRAKYKP